MSRFFNTGLSTLSSIRNQLTEFTTEVLNESTQEVQDPVSELSVAKKRVADLEQLLATRNAEVEKLRASNSELEERAHVFEFQLRQLSERHKDAIHEKEAEILQLQSISVSDIPSSSIAQASRHGLRDSLDDGSFSPPFSPSNDGFELRKLKEEVKQLTAECQHWKQLVKRDQDEVQKPNIGVTGDETKRLRKEVMELQTKLDELVENHQNELAALQEVHRNQVTTIVRSYEAKQRQQPGEDDDGWGANADWADTDEWNASSAADDRSQKSALPKMDTAEKVDLENRLASLELENKRLHKLVDDLRKDEQELSRLQEENSELQRSVEALDSEHATAVEKLLADRKQAEAIANDLKRELATVNEVLEKMEAKERIGGAEDEEAEKLKDELKHANDTIFQLRTQIDHLQSVSNDHQQNLEILRKEYESKLHNIQSRLGQSQDEKSMLGDQIDQLTIQCRELNVAYEDLNNQYEEQKAESGAVVGSNQELHRKLEALKCDLTEYEEKYEKCKRDNLQAMKQLESLTNELERLKTEYFNASASQVQSKKWHTEIVRLGKELEESLKKREELVKSLQDFQVVVDRFDQQIQRFRSENEQLRRENEELRVASGASSPNDFRRVFEDTDQELQILRRSLSEYQDTFVKKEKVWRDQMEALKEENEVLKSRTPSTPGSGRDSDSGEASSSGSASYVHIEMTTGPIGQQPSPQDSNGSGSLVETGVRRESQDLIVVDEDMHAMKSLIDQQRQTIEQLQERNRHLKSQILHLTTDNPIAFQDDHQPDTKPKGTDDHWDGGDGGGWNDWGDETENVDQLKETESEITLEPTKSKSAYSKPVAATGDDSQLEGQLKEMVEALNEKTDECEKLNQELEQKRRDVKEREELVQQVFTELKGLELQLADNRKREEELRNEVTKLSVDMARQREEMDENQQKMDKAHSVTEHELEKALNEKTTSESQRENVEMELKNLKEKAKNLEHQLTQSRSNEENLGAELSQLRSNLTSNANVVHEEYERLRGEHQRLIVEYSTAKREREDLYANFSNLQQESEILKSECATSRQEMENFGVEREHLLNEKDRLRHEIEVSKTEMDSMYKKEMEILTKEIDRLREDSARLNAELENRRTKIDEDLKEMEHSRQLEQDFKAYREEMDKTLVANSSNLETLVNEKQQLIVLLNEKHQENVRYHQECQRLAQLVAEEQTKMQVISRKAAQKPPSTDFQSQTDQDIDQERMGRRLQEMEAQLAAARLDLEHKSQLLNQLENQLKSQVVEKETMVKRELSQAIQAKDRAVGEMAASRQHAEVLQQQLKVAEDACQRQSKEIERLRAHLLQIEEAYTQEAVKAEERETELRRRLREAEQQLGSDLEYAKDGNRKMTDQLTDLRVQLESMADQRDNALLQYADSQIDLEKQQKALVNLQTVLQHLQHERDSMISNEVKRYKQETEVVKEQKRQLEQQLREIQKQLLEYQEFVNKSSTLMEQANTKEKIIADLKSQINAKDDQCALIQSKLNELQRIRDAKLDKDVIKNIFLGYFCAPSAKKSEVAHLLGAILGFSDDEFKKIDHGAGSGGWLQFLHLGGGQPSPHGRSAEQSIAAQFVQFLETESAPKSPAVAMSTAFTDHRSMTPGFPLGGTPVVDSRIGPGASRSSTPGLNFQLPTFASPGASSSADTSQGAGSDFLRDLLSKGSDTNVI